jgi:hypothetical protein
MLPSRITPCNDRSDSTVDENVENARRALGTPFGEGTNPMSQVISRNVNVIFIRLDFLTQTLYMVDLSDYFTQRFKRKI